MKQRFQQKTSLCHSWYALMVGHNIRIYEEGLEKILEKEFKIGMLLSPWNLQIVCVCRGRVGSCLLHSATAIDLLFLVVFICFSVQKVSQRNEDLQAFIYCFINYLGFLVLIGYLLMNNLVSSRRCKLSKPQLIALSVECW